MRPGGGQIDGGGVGPRQPQWSREGMLQGIAAGRRAGWVESVALPYRTRFSGQWVALSGVTEGLLIPGGTRGVWAVMAVLLDQPLRVVAGDEGVARHHASEPDLLREGVRHEVAAVGTAEREAAGGAGTEPAEPLARRYADRRDGLVAGAALGQVPAG